MSIELSVIHGNEWWSEKQCPVSKSWANMSFSRIRRSGPLSRRTPAIDSQHLTKYAPLLVKANCIYNSEPTTFLKSATPTPPSITSKTDCSQLHLLSLLVIENRFCTFFKIQFRCIIIIIIILINISVLYLILKYTVYWCTSKTVYANT